MHKLALVVLLALVLGSCASLPDDCSAGQTVVRTTDGWSCAYSASAVPSHTHQVTEILTSCTAGQVIVWNEQASGWVCRDAADHSHETAEVTFEPTYYTVEVSAGSEEDLATATIEGHRFCALSENRTGSGGRCEVLQTTDGFSLQAWARPNTRTECGAVCF